MRTHHRYFLLGLIGFACLGRLAANTLIYPVEGIDDLWKLNAEDFRQKYGGINITGLGVGDEGWYVRYRHENLTYFFGPVADRAEAQKKMWELESVRDAAIRNEPKLNSSQVDFVRFNYSGVYGKRGDTPFSGKGKSDDGKSGPDGDIDGDGVANKDDPDMDGDGIPNAQDGDVDGDGIPNGQDKYPYGSSDGAGGQDGANANGKGDGADGQLAGGEGAGGAAGQKGNQKGSKAGQAGTGENGQSQGDPNSPVGTGQNGMQQVASAQGGGTSGQRGSSGQKGSQSGQQAGQSGQQSGQSGSQSGQQGQQSGQSGAQGQSGQPSAPGQQGGSGSPLDLVAMLLKRILGL
ncbi:MAG: thrombospondin type 3 repeat-containing protein [Opitutaceae bacterium]